MNYSRLIALTILFLFAINACKKEDDKPESQANRAPGEFSVTTASDLNSVLISWTTSTDPDGDEVVFMVTLENDTIIQGVTETFYEVIDLEYETDYIGAVIASDPDGAERSVAFSFTTGIYPNVAPMPFDLFTPVNGAVDIDTPIMFNWNDAIDSDGDQVTYELLFDQNSQPTSSIAQDLSASQYSYSGIELEDGQVFYWQVIARDGQGGETMSDIYELTTTSTMTLANDEPGWEDRSGHSSVLFQNKMWVIGGNSCCGGRYNDVWSSSDGVNWIEEVSDAPWAGRTAHASVVFDNKIWIIGGNTSYTQSAVLGDVWYSENGVDWTLATAAPSFPARYSHHLLSYNGYMWLFGGRDQDVTFSQQQTWRTQNGVDWELVAEDNGMYYTVTQMVVFDDKMWRIAAYGDDRIFSSTNGIEWNLEQEESPFGERNGHSCTVHNGKMFLVSGSDNAVNELFEIPDVWSSVDGVNWELISSDAGFEAVNSAELLSYDGKLWLLGGGGGWQSFFVTNDVWYLE